MGYYEIDAFVILLAGVALFINQIQDFGAIGLSVLLLVVLKATTDPWMAALSLIVFAIAYSLHTDGNTLRHSIWHVLTKIAYIFLLL